MAKVKMMIAKKRNLQQPRSWRRRKVAIRSKVPSPPPSPVPEPTIMEYYKPETEEYKSEPYSSTPPTSNHIRNDDEPYSSPPSTPCQIPSSPAASTRFSRSSCSPPSPGFPLPIYYKPPEIKEPIFYYITPSSSSSSSDSDSDSATSPVYYDCPSLFVSVSSSPPPSPPPGFPLPIYYKPAAAYNYTTLSSYFPWSRFNYTPVATRPEAY